jgi:hypothetical protein
MSLQSSLDDSLRTTAAAIFQPDEAMMFLEELELIRTRTNLFYSDIPERIRSAYRHRNSTRAAYPHRNSTSKKTRKTAVYIGPRTRYVLVRRSIAYRVIGGILRTGYLKADTGFYEKHSTGHHPWHYIWTCNHTTDSSKFWIVATNVESRRNVSEPRWTPDLPVGLVSWSRNL